MAEAKARDFVQPVGEAFELAFALERAVASNGFKMDRARVTSRGAYAWWYRFHRPPETGIDCPTLWALTFRLLPLDHYVIEYITGRRAAV